MKILVLTLYPAPYRVALYEKLAEKHDITVFFEKDNDNRNPLYCTYSDKFKYYLLDSEDSNNAYNSAIRDIKQYDFVMLYEYHTMLSVRLIFKCILKKVKYAINCDGALEISKKFPKKQIKTFFVKHAALCLAGGTKAEEYFRLYKASGEKITNHHFTSVYEKDVLSTVCSDNKTLARKEHGIEGRKVAVSVGRLIESKNFDVLINCWAQMPSDYFLYIIGSGPEEETLKQLINTNNLNNVRLLGFLNREQILNFLPMCDLFLFATQIDVWGLVINEALAKGLPVISTDTCMAALDMVVDDVNGYIVPYTSNKAELAKSFLERTLSVINDKQKLHLLSENALITATHYTYENMASVVCSALEKIHE